MVKDKKEFIIAVDSGGTFTDCVVMDSEGVIHTGKSHSTPQDFSLGVVSAVETVSVSNGSTVSRSSADKAPDKPSDKPMRINVRLRIFLFLLFIVPLTSYVRAFIKLKLCNTHITGRRRNINFRSSSTKLSHYRLVRH